MPLVIAMRVYLLVIGPTATSILTLAEWLRVYLGLSSATDELRGTFLRVMKLRSLLAWARQISKGSSALFYGTSRKIGCGPRVARRCTLGNSRP
jgi:hypothetical protein